MKPKKMTEKQQAFVDDYIKTGDHFKSYLSAGYKPKDDANMRSGACQMLQNPNIQRALDRRHREVAKYVELRTGRSVADLAEVTMFWTDLLRDNDAKPADRLKASEYLAKTQSAFTDKIEIAGKLDTNPLSGLSTEELRELIKKNA